MLARLSTSGSSRGSRSCAPTTTHPVDSCAKRGHRHNSSATTRNGSLYGMPAILPEAEAAELESVCALYLHARACTDALRADARRVMHLARLRRRDIKTAGGASNTSTSMRSGTSCSDGTSPSTNTYRPSVHVSSSAISASSFPRIASMSCVSSMAPRIEQDAAEGELRGLLDLDRFFALIVGDHAAVHEPLGEELLRIVRRAREHAAVFEEDLLLAQCPTRSTSVPVRCAAACSISTAAAVVDARSCHDGAGGTSISISSTSTYDPARGQAWH